MSTPHEILEHAGYAIVPLGIPAPHATFERRALDIPYMYEMRTVVRLDECTIGAMVKLDGGIPADGIAAILSSAVVKHIEPLVHEAVNRAVQASNPHP